MSFGQEEISELMGTQIDDIPGGEFPVEETASESSSVFKSYFEKRNFFQGLILKEEKVDGKWEPKERIFIDSYLTGASRYRTDVGTYYKNGEACITSSFGPFVSTSARGKQEISRWRLTSGIPTWNAPSDFRKNYYKNGKLKKQGRKLNIASGLAHSINIGSQREYYKNGKIKRRSYFVQVNRRGSMAEGIVSEYRPDGSVKSRTSLSDGVLQGWDCSYNEQGRLVSAVYNHNGLTSLVCDMKRVPVKKLCHKDLLVAKELVRGGISVGMFNDEMLKFELDMVTSIDLYKKLKEEEEG
jgi:antitoxin component YwqK of YwqJK toxin-antitoxin module